MTRSFSASSFRPASKILAKIAKRSSESSQSSEVANRIAIFRGPVSNGAIAVIGTAESLTGQRMTTRRRDESALAGDWTSGRSQVRQSPWSSEDVIRWVALWAIGVIMLVIGWYLASGRPTFQSQLVPTDIAIGGAILVCLANVLWLLNGRQAVGQRMQSLLGSVAEAVNVDLSTSGGSMHEAGVRLVAGPGLHHFHRETCVMASGRDWPTYNSGDDGELGRVPCTVCRPSS